MKLIDCPKHGKVIAVLVDSILLRYKCSHCKLEEEENG